MIYTFNNSIIYYENNCKLINYYHDYIINLIIQVLKNNKELNINIIFNSNFISNNYNFNNNNKTITISLNHEHTLVLPEGRDNNKSPMGNIKYNETSNYLVRIHGYTVLNNSNIILDYSNPNIYNITQSNIFEDFSNKMIYISPSIYKELYFIKENRQLTTLTTFINTKEPRRNLLLNSIQEKNITHINIKYF